jgi:hypothetical protein
MRGRFVERFTPHITNPRRRIPQQQGGNKAKPFVQRKLFRDVVLEIPVSASCSKDIGAKPRATSFLSFFEHLAEAHLIPSELKGASSNRLVTNLATLASKTPLQRCIDSFGSGRIVCQHHR